VQVPGLAMTWPSNDTGLAGQDIWFKDRTENSQSNTDPRHAVRRDSEIPAVRMEPHDAALTNSRGHSATAATHTHTKSSASSAEASKVVTHHSDLRAVLAETQMVEGAGMRPLRQAASPAHPSDRAAHQSSRFSRLTARQPEMAGRAGVQQDIGDAPGRRSSGGGAGVGADMHGVGSVRASNDSYGEGSTEGRRLAGAAGDRDEPNVAWGWSGADKGWAKVPQDLAVVQSSIDKQRAAAAPPYVAPPVRTHWLMMDNVTSTELKEAGIGSGSGFGDGSVKEKSRRGSASRPVSNAGKAQTGPSVSENQFAGGGSTSSAHASTSVSAGKDAALQGTKSLNDSRGFTDAGGLREPVPPEKGVLQSRQQSSAVAPTAARTKTTFGWKALGNMGKGSKQSPVSVQQSENSSVAGRAAVAGEGQGQGEAENKGRSRGRSNILGWLAKGEAALAGEQGRLTPLDSLDSEYQLNSEDRRQVALDQTGPLSSDAALVKSAKSPRMQLSGAAKNAHGGHRSEGMADGAGAGHRRLESAVKASRDGLVQRQNPHFSPRANAGSAGNNVQGLEGHGNLFNATRFHGS
jgi:hypothetical protein